MQSETTPPKHEQQIHNKNDALPAVDIYGGDEQIDRYAREVLNLITEKTGIDVANPKTHIDFSNMVVINSIPRIATGINGWEMSGYYDENFGGEIALHLRQFDPQDSYARRPIRDIDIQLVRLTDPNNQERSSHVTCFVRRYSDTDEFDREEARMVVQESSTSGRDKIIKNSVGMYSEIREYRTSTRHRIFASVRGVLTHAGIKEQFPARPKESLKDKALRIIAKFTADVNLRRKVYDTSNIYEAKEANKLLLSVIAELPQFTMTDKHRSTLEWREKQRRID